jgi:hypothetical protein
VPQVADSQVAGAFLAHDGACSRSEGLAPGLMKSLGPAASTFVAPPECAQEQPAGELDLALGGASILQDGPRQLHDFGWD